MLQDIIAWIITAMAVIYFVRLIHSKFSGKGFSCADCNGCGKSECELNEKPKNCVDCKCGNCHLKK